MHIIRHKFRDTKHIKTNLIYSEIRTIIARAYHQHTGVLAYNSVLFPIFSIIEVVIILYK